RRTGKRVRNCKAINNGSGIFTERSRQGGKRPNLTRCDEAAPAQDAPYRAWRGELQWPRPRPTRTPMALTRDQAQQRTDDIQAFARELCRLEQEQALQLAPPQRAQLDSHHTQLLQRYRQQFDIDHST